MAEAGGHVSVAFRLELDPRREEMRHHVSTGFRKLAAVIVAVALVGVLGASASAQTTTNSEQNSEENNVTSVHQSEQSTSTSSESSSNTQTQTNTQVTVNGETIVDEQTTETSSNTEPSSVIDEQADAGFVTEESVSLDAIPSDEEIAQVIMLLIEELFAELGI
jgi:cytoskeletal protein RodZ